VILGLGSLVRVVVALGVVLALAAATSRWLSLRGRPAGPQRALRLVGVLPLGAGRGVAVVRVGARALVLGLGDRSVSFLCALEDPAEVSELEAPVRGFGEAWRQALRVSARWGGAAPRRSAGSGAPPDGGDHPGA
jgi:flagellar biogenesis protein FliO